ncbi:NADH-dependent flavin oxidoreductase [Paenibacillus harenae]|uniref:NADH-dependent flavin oxidoreductase n=1 Tax=Paenibacillus harenae TaxID=306543 RepID=UPI00279183B0|nr:NADH-dependent flavin oxidoreductase [Paenibacillus harenae]MDQ0060480.1 2,4-dienoyl-CoA reductase-like NADH-dependent reductase (Old Yellow Enzyme family) [Paenibacillus harenae]
MNERYQFLFEPLNLPNQIRLKNRVVMAPMTHMSSQPDGTISDQEVEYYTRRAQGVGMVITAATWVAPNGGIPGAPAADRDEVIPGLRKLASAIQEQGAKAILQIFHSGRQASLNGDLVSASAVPERREGALVPRELTETEVEELIHAYGQAARRAVESGFDGVEIHGANGNLLHQFFSPFTNRRSDRFGGALEKRMTFALEIVDEVKRIAAVHAKKPFIIGYRLSPEESETPGITMAETLPFIDALAMKGLDYLHISLKNYEAVPRRGIVDSRTRLAIIQERAGRHLPVIGVGNVQTPEDAINALQTGAQLVALGRELVMEPDWMKLIAEGNEAGIQTTLSLQDQHKLVIPNGMWQLILSVPGWFPVALEP